MKSFYEWLKEATAIHTGVGAPPDIYNREDDDHDDDDGKYWDNSMVAKIGSWINSKSPCYQKIIRIISDGLMQKYDGDNVQAKVLSPYGGYGDIYYSWTMNIDSAEFRILEDQVKITLKHGCDLWKYIPEIGYDRSNKAVENDEFMQYFFYNLLMNGNTGKLISSKAAFEVYGKDREERTKLLDIFLADHDKKYKMVEVQADEVNVRKNDTTSTFNLMGKKGDTFPDMRMEAIIGHKYSIDIPK